VFAGDSGDSGLYAARKSMKAGNVRVRRETPQFKEDDMNKGELTKVVAEEADVTQATAAKAVDAVFDTIADSLKKRDQVAIAGFGTFVAKTRAARKGRNPSTGKEIDIPEKTLASFKPASALKDL
jgi:DNA-binding protein HU-beta